MTPPIYLDYNGTTPHDPEVIAAMIPFLETEFGNPSSSHWYGNRPREAVMTARTQVARLLGCAPNEIVFTSGGTESNNFAIKGIAHAHRERGNHLITSKIEHPAVLEVCRHLETEGFEITYLPVNHEGMVSITDLEEAIRPETILITLMHANNEVGTILPIADAARAARTKGIVFHTDAAQSAGKIPTRVNELGVDLLSIAGHKLHAPKGVGALYIREGIAPEKFCHGAGQEMGKRAGTENVLEIVGLGKACEVAHRDLQRHTVHMRRLRDRLHEGLIRESGEIRLNGHPDRRLPNTLSLSFQGLQADGILEAIGSEVAISAGAACHSDSMAVSHVLQAMAVPLSWAGGTLRFSVGRFTTEAEVDRTIAVVSEAVKRLKEKVLPVP
ncbi:MAG: cysteine desulfurase family protein [Thermodesulfobacteriota bacterium]